jgi:hypothetical protein
MAGYGTDAAWQAYAAARGQGAVADATEALRDAARLRASEWLDGEYQSRFPGKRTGGRDQERAWPRVNAADAAGEAIPDDEVPAEIERATFEAALRELEAPGSLSPDVTPGRRVKRTSEAVGPLREDVEYFSTSGGAASDRPLLSVVEGILSGLLRMSANVSFVSRA